MSERKCVRCGRVEPWLRQTRKLERINAAMFLLANAVEVLAGLEKVAANASSPDEPKARDAANALWSRLVSLDWESAAQGLHDLACDLEGVCLGCSISRRPNPTQRSLDF